ncbi:hypothetical protein Tco_1085044 [Tanacetum coccineum]
MMYYQIIRADGSSKNSKIFSEMLDDFDRQDMVDLHRLVQERYKTTSPEGYDLLLWGDLKTLFEPCEEDEVWRNQQGYNLISWRLFDLCGVHTATPSSNPEIRQLVIKDEFGFVIHLEFSCINLQFREDRPVIRFTMLACSRYRNVSKQTARFLLREAQMAGKGYALHHRVHDDFLQYQQSSL